MEFETDQIFVMLMNTQLWTKTKRPKYLR